MKILLREREIRFGKEDFYECALHVENNPSNRVQQLELYNSARGLGDGDPALALARSFENKVGSDTKFGRPSVVLSAVACSEHVQMVTAYGENRIWPKARSDHSRTSDGNVIALCQ